MTIYTQYRIGVIEIYVPKDKPTWDRTSTKKIKLYKTAKRLIFVWMIQFTKEKQRKWFPVIFK